MVGLLASRLINVVDWQSLFYIGGILTLGLSIVLIRALPDSIEFLVMRGAARRDIRDLVMRICPTVDIASGCQFVIDDERTRGVPVSPLFSAGMVGGTVLLWASYFVTFMMLVTSGAWTPTLLRRAGFDGVQSSVAMALFALGSVFGTPLAGFLVNRFATRRVLPAALVGGAATLGAVGHAIQSSAFVIVCLGFAGFFLGVAFRFDRAGALAVLHGHSLYWCWLGHRARQTRFFVGPLAIGLLVNRGWQIGDCFAALEMAALCAALFTSVIGINRSCEAAKADRVTAATGEEL